MPRRSSPRSRERGQHPLQRRESPGAQRQRLFKLYLPLVVILAMVATAGLILLGGWARKTPEPTLTAEFLDGTAKGAKDAKVVMIEYSDFQCPFCGTFARTTARQIEETYVKGGQVRFIYRNFAFIGPESQWAAEASLCANEQGRFWDYHDKLFQNQAGENQGAFSRDNLKKFAASLGLDGEVFNQCLDSQKYANLVKDETDEGRSKGIRSTPTFFINGRKVEGALPFENFRQVIEEELRKGT